MVAQPMVAPVEPVKSGRQDLELIMLAAVVVVHMAVQVLLAQEVQEAVELVQAQLPLQLLVL